MQQAGLAPTRCALLYAFRHMLGENERIGCQPICGVHTSLAAWMTWMGCLCGAVRTAGDELGSEQRQSSVGDGNSPLTCSGVQLEALSEQRQSSLGDSDTAQQPSIFPLYVLGQQDSNLRKGMGTDFRCASRV
mgnify:CR=1 FL=1